MDGVYCHFEAFSEKGGGGNVHSVFWVLEFWASDQHSPDIFAR